MKGSTVAVVRVPGADAIVVSGTPSRRTLAVVEPLLQMIGGFAEKSLQYGQLRTPGVPRPETSIHREFLG